MNKKYIEAAPQLKALIEGMPYEITILSNASAFLHQILENINWVGFYLLKDDLLHLGPFQGKVACSQIPIGRGVCGTAVAQNQTQLVMDVHQFPGHIACDSASESEIVIPIHLDGKIYGVLDIDSPIKNRFSLEDQEGLEALVKILESELILCHKE